MSANVLSPHIPSNHSLSSSLLSTSELSLRFLRRSPSILRRLGDCSSDRRSFAALIRRSVCLSNPRTWFISWTTVENEKPKQSDSLHCFYFTTICFPVSSQLSVSEINSRPFQLCPSGRRTSSVLSGRFWKYSSVTTVPSSYKQTCTPELDTCG